MMAKLLISRGEPDSLSKEKSLPLIVRGLSSCLHEMYKQAAKSASWFLPLVDF